MASGARDAMQRRGGNREIVIRSSEVEDRPDATQVQWSAGWKEAPERHRILPEADTDWLGRHYYKELVAEVDGVIAGRVGLEAYRQPFAELIDLCIRPEYRRLGLGENLTAECEREAAKRGFKALFLQTELENHAAHKLYTGLGFVPTTKGKMLRMVKLIDCPILADFIRAHPLCQYACEEVVKQKDQRRAVNLVWRDYITQDRLSFKLEGEGSRTESNGIGPAISACSWESSGGGRALSILITNEEVSDLAPGEFVTLTITLRNTGKRSEKGVFQFATPPGILIVEPESNSARTFLWEAKPGETIVQEVVVRIEPGFEDSILYELNYNSVPICVETYWEGQRVLLNLSLPFATPHPLS